MNSRSEDAREESRSIKPATVFLLALAFLAPIHLFRVSQGPWFNRPPKPVGDGLEYESIAFNVWRGNGFAVHNKDPDWREPYLQEPDVYHFHLDAPERSMLTAGRPPAFPTLVALVYTVTGRDSTAFAIVRVLAGLCLAISGAIAAAVTSTVLGHLYVGLARSRARWLIVAASSATVLLAAGNRTLLSYTDDFLTEPWALLGLQLLLLTCICLPRETTATGATGGRFLNWCLSAGCLLGLLVLTRSIFIAWLPGIGLLSVLAAGPKLLLKKRILYAGALILVAAACCLPWWVRNVSVLGEFMPLGTQGPITLYGAYSDEGLAAGGEWKPQPEQRLREELLKSPEFLELGNDVQREVLIALAARTAVRKWCWEHWADLPMMAANRIYTHWNPYTGKSLVWKLLILVGCIALFVNTDSECEGKLRSARVWLVGLPLLSTLVAACLYTTGGRFLVPLYGVLFSLGGIGVAAICEWLLRLQNALWRNR